MKGLPLGIEAFVTRANILHNYFYDYSKVVYTNAATKVCIICPTHKEFFQRPSHHLSGNKCPKCNFEARGRRLSLSTEEFIKRSVLVHGLSTYDYSKVDYKGIGLNVCIVCPTHKEFFQSPGNHMRGNKCPECVKDNKRLPFEEFLSRARKVHGPDKYGYSKTVYKNMVTKICIICRIHGEFWQTPSDHLKYDCLKCGFTKIKKSNLSTTEEFINKAVSLYGERYDYSKVDYKGIRSKICIICRIHGEFWQTPNDHLGAHGCARCVTSQGEQIIKRWLDSKEIPYEAQYKFPDLVGKRNSLLMFDFYIPSKNLLIEFDGEQHFRPLQFGGRSLEKAVNSFENTKRNDSLKDRYCEKNNIPLLRIGFKDMKRLPKILTEEILEIKYICS